MSQLSNILPDYILPFAISVLAHSSLFDNPTDVAQLKLIEKCLWFILEPLINNKETFCFSLYKNLIDRMKHSKSAHQPEDQEVNQVSGGMYSLIILMDNSVHRNSGLCATSRCTSF